MSTTETRIRQQSPSPKEEKRGAIHPLMIIMVLLLAGVSMLFIALTAAMIYTRVTEGMTVSYPPWIFYVTVVVLLAATAFMRRAKREYSKGSIANLERHLLYSLGLTVLFLIVQVIGWIQFFEGAETLKNSNSIAYLFALSALHLAHVVAGIPFAVVFIFKFRKALKRDAELPSRRFMNALSLYWDFIDILWIILVAVLLITALISNL